MSVSRFEDITYIVVLFPHEIEKEGEGLCRYILRPPLAKDRLRKVDGNEYELKLKTPWADGTTSLRLSSMELLERLTSLIPPPKAHQVIYHGIFASRSKWRKKVLPLYKNGVKEKRLEKRLLRLSKKKERGNTDVYRASWVVAFCPFRHDWLQSLQSTTSDLSK